jgi:ribosomal protein L37AE/L43A
VDNDAELQDIIQETRTVFSVLRYRTNFIEDVEIRKAKMWGQVQGWKDQQIETVYPVTPKSGCDTCQTFSAEPEVSIDSLALDNIPPYHANCTCTLVDSLTLSESLKDEIGSLPPPKGAKMSDEPADKPLPDTKGTARCPECGKTAILKKDTPDIYNCRACKTSFRLAQDENEEVEDKTKQSEFAKCVVKATARLRTQHPDWDEGRIRMLAETACDHILQDTDDEEDESLADGSKMESCVLKVKARLRKKNPGWSDKKIKSSAFAICTAQLKGK